MVNNGHPNPDQRSPNHLLPDRDLIITLPQLIDLIQAHNILPYAHWLIGSCSLKSTIIYNVRDMNPTRYSTADFVLRANLNNRLRYKS